MRSLMLVDRRSIEALFARHRCLGWPDAAWLIDHANVTGQVDETHIRCHKCQSQRKSQIASNPNTTRYAAITTRLDVCVASPDQLAERACTAAPLGV